MEKESGMLMKFHEKMRGNLDKLTFFESSTWLYDNSKMLELINCLSNEEREEFDCDVRNIKWPKYIENQCRGL